MSASTYIPTNEVLITASEEDGTPLSASLVFDYLSSPGAMPAISPIPRSARGALPVPAPTTQRRDDWLSWRYRDACAENEGLKAHISVLETKLDNATQMMRIVKERSDAEAGELAQGAQYLTAKHQEINRKIAQLKRREADFEAYKRDWIAQINSQTFVTELKRTIQSDIIAHTALASPLPVPVPMRTENLVPLSALRTAEIQRDGLESELMEITNDLTVRQRRHVADLEAERRNREFLEEFVGQEDIKDLFELWVAARGSPGEGPSSSRGESRIERELTVAEVLLRPVAYRGTSVGSGESAGTEETRRAASVSTVVKGGSSPPFLRIDTGVAGRVGSVSTVKGPSLSLQEEAVVGAGSTTEVNDTATRRLASVSTTASREPASVSSVNITQEHAQPVGLDTVPEGETTTMTKAQSLIPTTAQKLPKRWLSRCLEKFSKMLKITDPTR